MYGLGIVVILGIVILSMAIKVLNEYNERSFFDLAE